MYNLEKITMTYLFFKYPDYASTMQNLCGFNLFNTESKYYIIQNFGNRIVNNYSNIIPLSTPLLTPLLTPLSTYIEHNKNYNGNKISLSI